MTKERDYCMAKERDYCVYRYILETTENVIYIGKTDASLRQRIEAHAKEEKFLPYLGQWRVEYIELANRVETDIVEKYLINILKPVLNEKDNVDNLTCMAITLPKWEPYEKYEEKKKAGNTLLLTATLKKAEADNTFFQEAYDAILEKKGSFISKNLHPSGILPLPSENCRITDVNVTQVEGGYCNRILEQYKEEIKLNSKQILANIWIPVADLWGFKESDYARYQQLKELLYFSNKLYEFKENGFQEDCDSERCVLHIAKNTELLSYYKELFYSIYESDKYYCVEINEEKYSAIPIILEEIAKEMIVLFRITGVIPYLEVNDNV